MSAFRVPIATYRVQLNLKFRFSDARDLVVYLHDLGISELYASPQFKARKGSSHGYDVADPQRVNSELGTDEEFEELVQKLKSYELGLLADIVPNHMVASQENPWWMDVLENGPSSHYARYFDIDWHPVTTKAAFLQDNKVLLGVLGDLYGNVLENQELSLRLDENGFFVRYHETRFPVEPKSYGLILGVVAERLRDTLSTGLHQLYEILELVEHLPPYYTTDTLEYQRRQTIGRKIKDRLWQLYRDDSAIRQVVDAVLLQLNGARENPESFDMLDRILSQQPYRLAYWKMALEELNYRRFFDINELVGLRVEDPRVFAERHRLILQLVRENKITGLRIDHIDGLYDPRGYLEQLQQSIGADSGRNARQNIYLVVEKILGEQESLPEDWPVAGTTGYDFTNAVNAVFIDPQGFSQLEKLYGRFVGATVPFADISYRAAKRALERLFAGELQALSHHLGKLAAQDRHARDLPLDELRQLLLEVTACMPVYRTYMRDLQVAARDRVFVERALDLARRRTQGKISDPAFAFLRRILLLDPPPHAEGQKEEYLRFVQRWQQFTGPAMAKGLEDTAFYIHNSLISLNEVGGDPWREVLPLNGQSFHLFNQERLSHWPHTMNATATHDTKRGEDVRARVNVLSELPQQWSSCLTRWGRWNEASKKKLASHTVPAPNEEVLIYQTLLGAWPADEQELPEFKNRLKAYLVKAAREAKTYTNWISPNLEHEAGLEHFVDSILDYEQRNRFLKDFLPFQKVISFYGCWNSLSQVLLKVTAPGVPDFYQGTELWDLSLVDPDNRRPVDFVKRARALEEIKAQHHRDGIALARELATQWIDGRVKLFLIWKALEYRRREKDLFADGQYLLLEASGKAKENVCAFVRCRGKQWSVTVAPRLLTRLVDPDQLPVGEVWGSGSLLLPRNAPQRWQNVLTGETLSTDTAGRMSALRLSNLFANFPVALLQNIEPEAA